MFCFFFLLKIKTTFRKIEHELFFLYRKRKITPINWIQLILIFIHQKQKKNQSLMSHLSQQQRTKKISQRKSTTTKKNRKSINWIDDLMLSKSSAFTPDKVVMNCYISVKFPFHSLCLFLTLSKNDEKSMTIKILNSFTSE